jgi:hypothetical protein
MNTSTRTPRRLRGLGLALVVAAVAAPAAQAISKGDYEIESARVQADAPSTYDAIEAHRSPPPRDVGSLAYELGRGATAPAAERRYDAIELVRTKPSEAATRLEYDGIELARARSPFDDGSLGLASLASS